MPDREQDGGEPKKPLKTNDALTPRPPSKAPPNRALAPRGFLGTEPAKAPTPQSLDAQRRVAEKDARARDKAALKGMVGRDREGRGPTILKKDFDKVR